MTDAATPAKSNDKLPVGTSPQYARMHTGIRRTCYVLLFSLVLEGALTFPLLAAWYGFPTLSLTSICSEMAKHRYADASRHCDVPYRFPGPPLAGPAEAEGQTTSRDVLGVQPKPLYSSIGFRELVKHHKACGAFEGKTNINPRTLPPDQKQLWDYCSYLTDVK